MSSFWSLWIIVLTSVCLILITWVLFSNRKRDATESDATTGHVYDGIEEYDNPLPAWWFYMFVMTIIWGIGYLIAYPGMGNFPGMLGWTQLEQYEDRVAAADERYGAIREQYMGMPIAEIADDPALRKMGMRMFGNNCAQCHGADAKGSYGFPNLTDDDWLYGGDPETIKASITQGRQAAMPAWAQVIGEQGVTDVTAFVQSLSGTGSASEATVAAGSKVYGTYCAACHGTTGEGNPVFGAPNLTDDVWLYGGSAEQIAHSVRSGRNGLMPAHEQLLSEDKIHILTAFVYGLRDQ